MDLIARRRPDRRQLMILGWLTLVAGAIGMWLLARHLAFPYSSDSAVYIEEARGLAATGRAVSTPQALFPLDAPQSPSGLFPIGFPLLLAAIQHLGMDPAQSAVGLSAVAALTLPFLLYWAFSRALEPGRAAAVATLGALSPGVLTHAGQGLTDSLALLIATLAAGLLLRARLRREFALAGVIAGCGYAVRNAHVALLAATALFFGLLWLSGRFERWRLFTQGCAFGLGGGAVVVAQAASNLLRFGTVNPYAMSQSTVGWLENARRFAQELVFDLTAQTWLAHALAWTLPGLAALALVLGAIFVGFWVRRRAYSDEQFKLIAFAAAYVSLGALVVVLARSRYQWGEMISIRHTLQYTPFCMAGLVAWATPAESGARAASRPSRIALTTIAALIAASQLFYLDQRFSGAHTGPLRQDPALSALAEGRAQFCAPDPSQVLVSNWNYVFIVACGASVRPIGQVNLARSPERQALAQPWQDVGTIPQALAAIGAAGHTRPVLVGLYPGRAGVEATDLPISGADAARLTAQGWTILENSPAALEARSPGSPAPTGGGKATSGAPPHR